jgi:teichuronic acid biosynthesis glycosyltransferase TuaG
MRDNQLVSIITPVYNAEKYLRYTIDSVLQQTYGNWELLLVDDCSTDSSFEMMQKAAQKDSRIRIFQNAVNSKAFESRNVALRNARGKYIAFLDADDLWERTKLEVQRSVMQKNGWGFTYTGFTRFLIEPSASDKTIHVGRSVTYKGLLVNTIIATSSVMLDVEKTGSFEMENVYYDDFVLWLTLLKRLKKAHGIDQPLLHYRISDNSLSRNKWQSAKKVYAIFTETIKLGYIRSRFYFGLWVINAVLRYAFRY